MNIYMTCMKENICNNLPVLDNYVVTLGYMNTANLSPGINVEMNHFVQVRKHNYMYFIMCENLFSFHIFVMSKFAKSCLDKL